MMSQTDPVSASSLPIRSQGIFRAHACEWAWCRLTFSSNIELRDHVITQHVHQVVPVMRRDIPMLRRAEEGFGESLSTLGGIGGSIRFRTFHSDSPSKQDDISADCEPSSSLPSPPASSPVSRPPFSSFEPIAQSTLVPKTPPFVDHERNAGETLKSRERHPFDLVSSRARLPSNFSSNVEMPTTPQHNSRTRSNIIDSPTYASLSSPGDLAPVFAIPNTPTFNSMVENATNIMSRNQKRPFSSVELRGIGAGSQHNSQESHISTSSSGSHDFVEQQLTQSLEEDGERSDIGKNDKNDVYPSGGSREFDHSPVDTTSRTSELKQSGNGFENSQAALYDTSMQSSPPQSQPISQIQTPHSVQLDRSFSSPSVAQAAFQRQAWYQPPRPKPPRKKARRGDSGSPIVNVSHPTNVFRSGTLQISPSASATESRTDRMNVDSQDIFHRDTTAQSQSQFGYSQSSQSSSQFTHSGMIQTQAPYQSQSLSQL